MALTSVSRDFVGSGDVRDGKWELWSRWDTAVGSVETWIEKGQSSWASPVRVTGDVPNAVAEDLFCLGTKVSAGTSGHDRKYVAEVEPEVDGHDLIFHMPKRGLTRRARRVYITIDGNEYVARARLFGSSQIERSDGAPLWRSPTFRNPQIADDTSPIEVTAVALFESASLDRRLVLSLWHNI